MLPTRQDDQMAFFKELQRRNVYRVGIAYVVTAWLILQVADVILGNMDVPDWLFGSILTILALGFPLALVLAWAFELTPEGIKRDRDVDRTDNRHRAAGHKFDRIIIAVLGVAVVYFVADKWLLDDGESNDASVELALEKSIAVLPFVNRSSLAEDAYFVDGMHDDILTQLAKISGLEKVISRTSTERYRDTEKSMQQIGQELGVATILEGGVQRAGNRVRINMQLINAATDRHIWADSYDRELSPESLFEIQTEIAREVVTALHAVLTEEEEERLAVMPTDNLEAYEQFVLGRQELAKRTAEAVTRAIGHFQRAVELDPNYALAYVGLADSAAMQVEYAGLDYAASVEPRQRYIDQALGLDPLSGEAYAALGLLRYWGREWEAAETAFEKAVELSPNYPHAYHWYSILLRRVEDRRAESLVLMRKAVSLDPAAPILIASLADNLRFLGRLEEAEAAVLDGVRQTPEFPSFYIIMKDLLIAQGRLGEAAAWLDRANALNPSNTLTRTESCHLFIELDDADGAEDCLTTLRSEFPQSPLAVVELQTNILTVRGDDEGAIEYAQSVAASNGDPLVQGNLVAAYMMNGAWDQARAMLERFTPKFYGDGEIVVSPSEVEAAVNAAATMRDGDGWSERGQYLAGKALETMKAMHRTRGIGFRFLDVAAHGIRGEAAEGISALRKAIDSNWRFNWWVLRLPAFDVARDDDGYGPQWNALIAELEADIALQRRWYYANKDGPLF